MEKYCPNCNRTNPSDAAFCRHCASPLTSGAGGSQQQPFNNPRENQQQWNPPPPHGGQMQGNFAAADAGAASGRAIASLVLAIAGFLLCCFFAGIPAAILGWLEVTAIKEGRSSPKGLMMAQIGLWGGIAGSILSAIFSFLWMLMAMMGGGGGGYNY